jgi:RNA polymerase sigma-70 factor (ECF subfamily)
LNGTLGVDSDAALVARVVADDERSAFELLVRRHQSPLRNFLRRLTRDDSARADDLAQETFLKAYRMLGSFRGAAAFRTWLYRIAYNCFLNDERGRVAMGEFDEGLHSPASADTAPDAEIDVERALALLPARRRAVFDLCYRKGMTQAEVAEVLEIPLGTVKSEMSRGQARLRELLGLDEE